MRKFFIFLMSCVLVCVLVGCSANLAKDEAQIETEETASEEALVDPEEVPEPQTLQNKDKSYIQANDIGSAVSFNNAVLVDNVYSRIELAQYDPAGPNGPTVTFHITNKTDSTITLSAPATSLNSIMFSSDWRQDVLPGKQQYSSISWTTEELSEQGINFAEEFGFLLAIVNEDNDLLFENVVTFSIEVEANYPSVVMPYVSGSIQEQVLVKQDGIKVSASDFQKTNKEAGITILVENSGDTVLKFSATNVMVNNMPCDPQWVQVMLPQTYVYSKMLWPSSLLSYSGTSMEEGSIITFTLVIENGITGKPVGTADLTVHL